MTNEEWITFQKTMFTAFPGIWEWVKEKSPNPLGTLDTWFQTLRDVSFDEATSVLNRWKNGTREPPKAYERDYVAIVIRQTVAFDRDKNRRFEVARDIAKTKSTIMKRRGDYEPYTGDLMEAFLVSSQAFKRMNDGEISREEYNRICREVTK